MDSNGGDDDATTTHTRCIMSLIGERKGAAAPLAPASVLVVPASTVYGCCGIRSTASSRTTANEARARGETRRIPRRYLGGKLEWGGQSPDRFRRAVTDRAERAQKQRQKEAEDQKEQRAREKEGHHRHFQSIMQKQLDEELYSAVGGKGAHKRVERLLLAGANPNFCRYEPAEKIGRGRDADYFPATHTYVIISAVRQVRASDGPGSEAFEVVRLLLEAGADPLRGESLGPSSMASVNGEGRIEHSGGNKCAQAATKEQGALAKLIQSYLPKD